MAPKLSVVVPFFGVEDYIGDCLATIQQQTLADFECILVDDGSRDGSRAVAERYAASDPRFRILSQANAGLAAARNAGTRVAVGEYLMFVDSDDLLAPRAFQQLVTTLDRTGSDFAGGNVWRYSLRWGLVVSTAHEEQFRRRRDGVTIDDVPLLMRDRMIWNKVYRRSFWDAHGYVFPDMRFEDYPVTLRAHLEAGAVDLLPDPLYVWREREAGTSISQQGSDIANVRDRVRAVHLVLDFVDALASPDVKALVDSYFVEVDLRETMLSLLAIPDADADELERLIASVAERIHPDRVYHAPEFNQLFYRAARAGHWALCRALARWWNGEGLAGLRRELKGVPRPSGALAEALALAVEKKRPRPLATRRLECTLRSLQPADGGYRVVVDVKLRPQVAAWARVRVLAGSAESGARRESWAHGLALTVLVPGSAAVDGTLRVEVVLGPLRWSGTVGTDLVPPLARAAAGWWVQPVSRGGRLGFLAVPDPLVVDAAAAEEGVLTLHVATPGVREVAVERPYPDAPVVAGVAADGTVRFVLADLLAGDPPDNPVTRVGVRPLVAGPFPERRPLHLACPPVESVAAGRRVTVGPGHDGHAILVHRPEAEADA